MRVELVLYFVIFSCLVALFLTILMKFLLLLLLKQQQKKGVNEQTPCRTSSGPGLTAPMPGQLWTLRQPNCHRPSSRINLVVEIDQIVGKVNDNQVDDV